MADDSDVADIRQAAVLDAAIKNICEAAKVDIVGDGQCIVCGNVVAPVLCNGKHIIGRWCSVECRDITDL